jgi:hypothetical protein
MNRTSRLYAFWAVALLGLTLLAGVHMRAAFAWPVLRGGLGGPNLVHAHSHVGFFGWAVLAVCALLTSRAQIAARQAAVHRVLAHVIGIGSAAAFVGFALRGYDVATIALSAFHVLLWLVLVVLVWRDVGSQPQATRPFVRTALLFLAGAGLATVVPVMLMVRGVADPWLQQLGVKLFLTPFVTGFLLLVALGTVYGLLRRPRHARTSLVLIALGVLPSTLLYVSAAPPAVWLPWAGRAGMALVASGTLLFVADAVRNAALPPLAWVVVLMAAAKAGLELLAAAGVGAAIMHNRAITIAVLHIVLLGIVTPALMLGLRPRLRAPLRTAVFVAGLVAMTVAVGITGWPWAARLLILRGVQLELLLIIAAVAGAVSAVALLSLLRGAEVGEAEPDMATHEMMRARRDAASARAAAREVR